MCNTNESIQIQKEAYALCRSFLTDKLKDCYLYGSYARGDYHQYSDVDIMMVVDMNYDEISSYRRALAGVNSGLSLKHDVTVSVKLQPLEMLKLHPELPFYKNVMTEGIRYGI